MGMLVTPAEWAGWCQFCLIRTCKIWCWHSAGRLHNMEQDGLFWINQFVPCSKNVVIPRVSLISKSHWPACFTAWKICMIDEPGRDVCNEAFISTFHKTELVESRLQILKPSSRGDCHPRGSKSTLFWGTKIKWGQIGAPFGIGAEMLASAFNLSYNGFSKSAAVCLQQRQRSAASWSGCAITWSCKLINVNRSSEIERNP